MTTPDKKKSAELQEQIARFKAKLVDDPETTTFPQLADLYTRAGQLLDAIQVCRDGLKKHPRLAAAHVSLGRALFGSGNLPVAAKVLHRSLSLDDVTGESFRLLGEVMMRLSRPVEAVKLLERAKERGFNEKPIVALLKRAKAAVVADRRAKAEADGDRGLGNVAVSGTINTDDEETRPMPALAREDLEEKSTDFKATVDRAPGVERGVAPRVKTDLNLRRLPLEIFRTESEDGKQQGWSTIDDAWERTLDASQVSSRSKPKHKTPTPGFEPIDVQVAPLTDPMAESLPPRTEMPPVPDDAEEEPTSAFITGEALDLMEELVPTVPEEPSPLADELEEMAPTEALEAPQEPLSEEELTPRLAEDVEIPGQPTEVETPPLETPALETPALETPALETPALEPATREEPTGRFEGLIEEAEEVETVQQQAEEAEAETFPMAPEREAPDEGVGSLDAEVAHVGEDGIEEAGDEELDELMGDPEDAPTVRFVRPEEDALFQASAAPSAPTTAPVAAPADARRRRLTVVLLILGVLVLFAVGTALGWYLYEHRILGRLPATPAETRAS